MECQKEVNVHPLLNISNEFLSTRDDVSKPLFVQSETSREVAKRLVEATKGHGGNTPMIAFVRAFTRSHDPR